MVRAREITGTPFKTRSLSILRRKNRRLRELSAQVRSNKESIRMRNIRDTIEARGIPPAPRPGAIE